MKKSRNNGTLGGVYDRNLTNIREMNNFKYDIDMNNSSMKTFRIINKKSKIDKVDAP